MILQRKLQNIKAIVADVDGVLTDGKIIVHADGSESKEYSVRDGQMVVWGRVNLGLRFGAISGRGGGAVEHRLRSLKFDFIHLEKGDKEPSFQEFLNQFGLKAEEVLYIGDDLLDIPLLKLAGVGVCPADAARFVSGFADYQTKARGGKGVLREVVEEIAIARMGMEDLLEQLQ